MTDFLPKFNIHKENDFNERNMNSIPLGNNNISIQKQNFDLKTDSINNIKPMLGNSNKIHIPEGTKVKIKPSLNSKKVPNDTFSMMANQRRSGLSSAENSDDETLENDILSNQSNQSNINFDEDDENDEIFSDNSQNYEENEDEDEDEDNEEYEEDEDDESQISIKKKEMSYEDIQQEKQKLLFNLDRLQKQGYPPSKRYSMASSYEDLNYEHERLKKQRDVEKSIKFSRKILMAFTSGIEFLNNRFDPLDIKLDGWSENMMENVNDYDEVFEELHDKYGESVKMAPELKLISMVAGSGFMFHLTNSLFKSAAPDLKDILKQNPDIMKNIGEAAAKNMNQNIDSRFGESDPIGNMMKSGISGKVSSMNSGGQQTMSGPKGIDDLIGELNDDDDASISSEESMNMSSSSRRAKKNKKKGGYSLSI